MHRPEAEQSVIGTILLEGTLFETLTIEPGHFYEPRHQRIFEAMREINSQGKAIDVVTVTHELGDDIQSVGGVMYLTQLVESIPSTISLKHYESIVFESYRARETRKLAMQYAEDPSDEDLHKLINNLEKTSEIGIQEEEATTKDTLLEIAAELMEPPEQNERGYKTGFADFDEMTGGVQPTDLVIIAARPSVGKTAFALNIGAGHCKNDGTTHIFSLEMPRKQLLHRMISAEGRIDGQKWRSMRFSEEDYNRAMIAIGIVSDWNLHIHEQESTINQIKAKIRKEVSEKPDERHLVIIDYLQLITSTGRYERRDLEVGAMTRELKMLAKELDIPIILLSQLNRAVESRQDKRPMQSDLRESGNIEQDADVIGFLYRDDYYDTETTKQNIIEIILSKQRNGPTGTVELQFQKEFGKFNTLAKWYEGDEQIG
jgi:replicative DNA helicase